LTGINDWGTVARMNLPFVDRERELREVDAAAKKSGLLVVYGRRDRPFVAARMPAVLRARPRTPPL